MYVRRIKSRNSICFQIGNKINGKFVLVRHIGCASTVGQIEALRKRSIEECERLKLELQPSLFPVPKPLADTAKLSNWRITGFHQVFGHVYDIIGFPDNCLRDLTIARIVYPKSKAATIRYLDEHLGISLTRGKLYPFLDTLKKDELTKTAFDFVSKSHGGIALIFYDVTTLYFESNNEDALRQKGYSKDHKSDLPQILIGLFVDKEGYPFDFDFYEGSTFEGHTFPNAIKAVMKKYQFEDLVIVADAGMLSDNNIAFLEIKKLKYIVGARLKSMSEKQKTDIFAHDFITEQRHELASQIKLESGELRDKRLIIDYSEKRAYKDKFNRDKLIKKLEARIASKKELVRKSKYLILENKGKVAGIDREKIELDKRYDGLKGYWTNLDGEHEPQEIIDKYHNLWKVEKAFRMSKSDLQERPMFHRRLNRIKGHLLVCFCSLLVMKETEKLLKPTSISLSRSIEKLSKVGQGEMTLGKITMPIESESDQETRVILDQILGH